MAQPSFKYLHLPSIGDLEACQASRKTLQIALEELFTASKIDGYLIQFIRNPEALIEKLVSFDFSFLSAAEYPFLYITVQPIKNNFELAKGLYHLGFIPIHDDFQNS